MHKNKKKKEKFLSVGVTLRESPIFAEQLKALVEKFGENRSRVIVRAVGEAYQKYCANPTPH